MQNKVFSYCRKIHEIRSCQSLNRQKLKVTDQSVGGFSE